MTNKGKLHSCMWCGYEPTWSNVTEANTMGTCEADTEFSVYCECGLVAPLGKLGDRADAVAQWDKLQAMLSVGKCKNQD